MSDRTRFRTRPRCIWLDVIAIAFGGLSGWSAALFFVDRHSGPSWLIAAIPPALIAWGLWFRRPWGRSLTVGFCWLMIVIPPIVALSSLVVIQYRDGIGPGVFLAFSLLLMVFVTPVALLLRWLLSRREARELFNPST